MDFSFKGIPSEVEYEDGSGTSLNGCLKVGMFLGFFSGQKKESCFVEKVGLEGFCWGGWGCSGTDLAPLENEQGEGI